MTSDKLKNILNKFTKKHKSKIQIAINNTYPTNNFMTSNNVNEYTNSPKAQVKNPNSHQHFERAPYRDPHQMYARPLAVKKPTDNIWHLSEAPTSELKQIRQVIADFQVVNSAASERDRRGGVLAERDYKRRRRAVADLREFSLKLRNTTNQAKKQSWQWRWWYNLTYVYNRINKFILRWILLFNTMWPDKLYANLWDY